MNEVIKTSGRYVLQWEGLALGAWIDWHFFDTPEEAIAERDRQHLLHPVDHYRVIVRRLTEEVIEEQRR